MHRVISLVGSSALVAALFLALSPSELRAQDWPQWRGPNRDAKALGFKAPATWPAELTKKWTKTVGDGVASPSLAGGRLYVFSRQGDDEVIRCFDAASGDEVWQDKYSAKAPTGGAGNFPGPRASPTIVGSKVITLGVEGKLTCYDASKGVRVWQKDAFPGSLPMFFPASSPIVIDGVCIAQLGGDKQGGVIAYDVASGDEKWKWTGDGPSYGSAVLINVDGMNVIVEPTGKQLVGLNAADGKLVWSIPYTQGRYNTATPIVSGTTMIIAGPGTGFTALKLARDGNELKEEKLWTNTDNSVQFNTPVLRDDILVGVSNGGQLFCVNTQSGKTAWTAPIVKPAEGEAAPPQNREALNDGPGRHVSAMYVQLAQAQQEEQGGERPRREGDGGGRGEGMRRGGGGGPGGGMGRGGRGGRGGGGRSGAGYGSVVDAGSVLLALSPAAELVVFQPSDQAFTQVARYKVAQDGTYAYPVAAGSDIYIKDKDSVTKWSVE